MAYEINYDDKRFQEVESGRKEALTEIENAYGGMIDESEKYYQAQIDASKAWAAQQQQLQQQKTDFAIEQIEQQKDQAKKDYTKEQSGAYVDWQKQSNQYGANAEQMAAQGLQYSGYSESSQVSMYNQYQNRVATARENFNLIIQNYNNKITDARLQNNSVLAEIAYNALQQQLELSLQGFQYKNQLLLDKVNQKTQVETRYDSKYQAVLDQMNQENALAEEVRQYNESMAMEQQKYQESVRQYNEQMAEEKRQYDATLAEQQRQYNASLAEEQRQYNATLAEQQRQYNTTQAQKAASASSSSSSKSSSSKSSSSGSTTVKKTSTSSASAKNKPSNFTTYEQAASYLRSVGATSGDGGLMTKSEWASRKSRGSSAAEVQYDTYSEYLNAFVAWKAANADKTTSVVTAGGAKKQTK